MAPNIPELVRQVPPADRYRLLLEVAKSLLDAHPDSTPVVIADGMAPPIGYLFRMPPMPESDLSPEEEAAEDARRMATLDDAVTAEEMLALLDFGAAAKAGQP
jgi:hypothetical protein